ncbi:MAG: hypothetical protein R3F55_21185 [Alphaproteobacteria bacterium]
MDGWTVRRDSAPGTPVDQDPAEAIRLADGRQAWQITLRDPLALREHPPASQAFTLVPPPGASAGGPIRLPSPAPSALRQTGTGEPIAEMFVSL